MRITTFLMAMMTVFTLSAADAVNLFKNGDFSEGTKFWSVSPGVTVSKTVKNGEKNAVCVLKQKSVRQTVTIDPNGIYELTFKAKGENIVAAKPNQGARVIIRGGKRYARGTADSKGKCMTGTFDWQEGKCILKGSYFQSDKLHFNFYLDCEGKCYYSDVKLVKINSDKKTK